MAGNKHKIRPLIVEPLFKTHNTVLSKSFRLLRMFLFCSTIFFMLSLPLIIVYGYKITYYKFAELLVISFILTGVIKLIEQLIKRITGERV